jgi:hypothetical protein
MYHSGKIVAGLGRGFKTGERRAAGVKVSGS